MAENVELIFHFKTEGDDRLERVKGQLNALKGEVHLGSDAIARLGGSFEAATGRAGNAAREFSRFGATLKDEVLSAALSLTGSMSRMATAAGPAGIAVAAVGTAAAFGARQMLDLVAAQGKASESIINFADRLGIGIAKAEQWQSQMRIVGVESGALEGAVRVLALALEDPTGAGERAAKALQDLGVATHEVTGAKRELGPVLLDVVDRLSRISSDSERAAAAQRLLGRGAAVELLPWIKNLRDVEAAAKDVGVGLNENLTKSLAKTDDAIDIALERLAQLKKTLTEPLVGPVNSLLHLLARGTTRELVPSPRESFRPDLPVTPISPITVLTPEMQLVEAYRRRSLDTERGLQQRLRELQTQLAEEESLIFGTGAGAKAKAAAVERAEKLAAEIKRVEEALRSLNRAVKEKPLRNLSREFEEAAGVLALRGQQGRAELLGRDLPSIARSLSLLRLSPSGFAPDVNPANVRVDERSDIERLNDQLIEHTLRGIKRLAEENEKQESIRERMNAASLDAALRLARLGDDEYQAAVRVLEVRRQYARDAAEIHEAELDFQARVREIEERRFREYREQARGVFRALTQGGAGLDAFIRGQGTQLAEQLFVNLSGQTFQRFGGTLGRLGAASGLPDWLLRGTIFDPQNADPVLATRDNTDATVQNTSALTNLTAALAGGSGGGAGTALGSILGGVTGNPLIFNSVGRRQTGAAGSPLDPGFNWLRFLGYAGAGAGAGFGIYSGIQEGGGRGAATAVGSALGAAALIPGPQQPFVAAGALIAGFVRSFFPDPKKEFAEAQDRLLRSRVYRGPEPLDRAFDFATGAQFVDTNFRGQTRVIVQRNVTVNINALDMQSLESRGADIARIVADETRAGNPDMQLAINQVAFGPGA